MNSRQRRKKRRSIKKWYTACSADLFINGKKHMSLGAIKYSFDDPPAKRETHDVKWTSIKYEVPKDAIVINYAAMPMPEGAKAK